MNKKRIARINRSFDQIDINTPPCKEREKRREELLKLKSECDTFKGIDAIIQDSKTALLIFIFTRKTTHNFVWVWRGDDANGLKMKHERERITSNYYGIII